MIQHFAFVDILTIRRELSSCRARACDSTHASMSLIWHTSLQNLFHFLSVGLFHFFAALLRVHVNCRVNYEWCSQYRANLQAEHLVIAPSRVFLIVQPQLDKCLVLHEEKFLASAIKKLFPLPKAELSLKVRRKWKNPLVMWTRGEKLLSLSKSELKSRCCVYFHGQSETCTAEKPFRGQFTLLVSWGDVSHLASCWF